MVSETTTLGVDGWGGIFLLHHLRGSFCPNISTLAPLIVVTVAHCRPSRHVASLNDSDVLNYPVPEDHPYSRTLTLTQL